MQPTKRIYLSQFQIIFAKAQLFLINKSSVHGMEKLSLAKYHHCSGKRHVSCKPLQQHHAYTPHIHTTAASYAQHQLRRAIA